MYIQETVRLPKSVQFSPLEDITAYELAKILPLLVCQISYPEDFIPRGCERHFKISS